MITLIALLLMSQLLRGVYSVKPRVVDLTGDDVGARFKWTASLDRRSGVACSKETSRVPARSSLARHLEHAVSDHEFCSVGVDLFSSYPEWLCRFPVTFGCLKAVHMDSGGLCRIQDRLFGFNLLTFGKAQRRSVSFRAANKNMDHTLWSQCCIEIPIKGGIMTLPGNHKNDKLGSLFFMLIRSQRMMEEPLKARIVTWIADYHPSLAGRPPVHPIRKGLYLGTQSVVHGYVMWRFHRRTRNFGRDQVKRLS